MKTLLLILTLSIAAAAQTPYSESTDPKASSVVHLPGPDKAGVFVKIAGDTFADVEDIARHYDLKKSEFETKREYLQRVVTWAFTTSNAKTKKHISETVFVFNDDIASYDAETRQFTVRAPDYYAQMVKRPTGQHGPLEIIDYTEWSDTGRWTQIRSGLPTLTFDAMPAVARTIKPDIAVAVYGIPVSLSDAGGIIGLMPLRIVAFNKTTDEVYAIKDVLK